MPRKYIDPLLTPSALQQVSYRAHKSLGLCARCPNTPLPGQACCQACLDEMAARKQQARDAGLCLDCWTEPALVGKRYCATHEAGRKTALRQRYWTRRFRHLCVKCGKKRAYKNFTLCQEHLNKERQRKKAIPHQIQESGA